MVGRLGNTRRLPVFCTVPMVWSMATLVASPVTCHRRVDDWPIRIEVGSVVNCAITGAAGFTTSALSGAVAGSGGGGGGIGAFLLPHPAANTASEIARKMVGLVRFSEHEHRLLIFANYFPHAGFKL